MTPEIRDALAHPWDYPTWRLGWLAGDARTAGLTDAAERLEEIAVKRNRMDDDE